MIWHFKKSSAAPRFGPYTVGLLWENSSRTHDYFSTGWHPTSTHYIVELRILTRRCVFLFMIMHCLVSPESLWDYFECLTPTCRTKEAKRYQGPKQYASDKTKWWPDNPYFHKAESWRPSRRECCGPRNTRHIEGLHDSDTSTCTSLNLS